VTTTALTSLVLLAVFVAADVWVYADAKRCSAEGAPVQLRIGSLVVGTPGAWLLACVMLWVFFFPMYLLSRSR
jgi:hypothetical protein